MNEDLAVTAAWGTPQSSLFDGVRYDGIFALWYGKGPGVDRSLDAIRHANADGTDPGGDDHGAVSSTLPHQTEHDMIAVQVPVLAPAGVQDDLRFGLSGWDMSRASGAWVGFKCQTEVVESSATVWMEGLNTPAVLPEGSGTHALRWPDGRFPKEARIEKKLAPMQDFARAKGLDHRFGAEDAKIGIVSAGKSRLDLRAALARLRLTEEDVAAHKMPVRYVFGAPLNRRASPGGDGPEPATTGPAPLRSSGARHEVRDTGRGSGGGGLHPEARTIDPHAVRHACHPYHHRAFACGVWQYEMPRSDVHCHARVSAYPWRPPEGFQELGFKTRHLHVFQPKEIRFVPRAFSQGQWRSPSKTNGS